MPAAGSLSPLPRWHRWHRRGLDPLGGLAPDQREGAAPGSSLSALRAAWSASPRPWL